MCSYIEHLMLCFCGRAQLQLVLVLELLGLLYAGVDKAVQRALIRRVPSPHRAHNS